MFRGPRGGCGAAYMVIEQLAHVAHGRERAVVRFALEDVAERLAPLGLIPRFM